MVQACLLVGNAASINAETTTQWIAVLNFGEQIGDSAPRMAPYSTEQTEAELREYPKEENQKHECGDSYG
jgi:hypothetical protein